VLLLAFISEREAVLFVATSWYLRRKFCVLVCVNSARELFSFSMLNLMSLCACAILCCLCALLFTMYISVDIILVVHTRSS
jgi:hypothetical protein